MSRFTHSHKDGAPPPIYDLYGVVNHMGLLLGGHYTAYARCADPVTPLNNEVGMCTLSDSFLRLFLFLSLSLSMKKEGMKSCHLLFPGFWLIILFLCFSFVFCLYFLNVPLRFVSGWREFNDRDVSPIANEKKVVSRSAYLLFYRLRSPFVPPIPRPITMQVEEGVEVGEKEEVVEDDNMKSDLIIEDVNMSASHR
jgi:hypothetical protein